MRRLILETDNYNTLNENILCYSKIIVSNFYWHIHLSLQTGLFSEPKHGLRHTCISGRREHGLHYLDILTCRKLLELPLVADTFSLGQLDMEDLYLILQCDPTSTQEQLKQSFKRLALQHHPDKGPSGDGSFFVKLNNAWEILGNQELRQEYDVKWRERCIVQDRPIHEEIEFSELYSDESEEIYSYPCEKCEGVFILTKTDAKLRFDIVCCDTCSSAIRVLYKDAQYPNNNTAHMKVPCSETSESAVA